MQFNVLFVAKMIYAHFFLANTINPHFFVAKMIRAHLFCCKNNLYTLFCRENDLRAFFVAKTISALCPESFCALKVAIRKVQTFWASASMLCFLQMIGLFWCSELLCFQDIFCKFRAHGLGFLYFRDDSAM